MSKYKHGIATSREQTQAIKPDLCENLVQCAIGTAPINTLKDPYAAVNVPILLSEKEDVEDAIGSTADVEKYTLMHSVYATFEKHAVSPLVVINVLDPNNPKHVEAVADKEITLVKNTATIEDAGILLDKLVVSDDTKTYKSGDDYVASFDAQGYVIIAVTKDGELAGKSTIKAAYSKLNPAGVTQEDIIGGVDENHVKSGTELLDDVYPVTGMISGIVTAPMYSKYPAVAVALEAKVQKVYGMFNGIAFVDLDSSGSGAKTFDKAEETKDKNVPSSRWITAFYPCVKSDGYVLSMSAFASALLQSVTANNEGIPSESIDNMDLKVDGICTEDGTAVTMTQDDVNDYLNRCGIVGAIKLPSWKAWGNNTTAYPKSTDPIDRWVKGVTMLNYLENRFKSDYLSRIGRNASYKTIESVVSEYNMTLNALCPDYLAGAEIVFDRKENPLSKLMQGHLVFRTRYADYAPAEYIENTFAYDTSLLEQALEGGTNE